MTAKFFAKSIADIAAMFRSMADDSDRIAKTVTTRRERLDAEVASRVWRDAAAVLDQTTIGEPDTRTQGDKDYDMDRYSAR